jgi:hypothetical protein
MTTTKGDGPDPTLVAKLAEYLHEREEKITHTKLGPWVAQPAILREVYEREAWALARFLRALKRDREVDVRRWVQRFEDRSS